MHLCTFSFAIPTDTVASYLIIISTHSQVPEVPIVPEVMIFGFAGSFFGLLLSPYCPRFRLPCTTSTDTCFVDAACIHQTNKVLMQRGQQG